jgi:Domain of unknown function (DUF4411)
MERYVMDSSFFLDLWKEDGPFSKEIFVGIWDAVEEGVGTGQIIAPKIVREEIRNTNDQALKSWISDRPGMFITFDQDQLASLTEVVCSFDGYAQEARNLADPQVVALARVRGLTVLTSEKRVSTLGKNPKMPNVCEAFGVPWLSVKSYCAAERIELHRAVPNAPGARLSA